MSSFFAFVSKLPVRGLPGVPGENVPLRVVEELMNVTERVQTRPQATEERTVSGLQLLHNTAKAFIVQVRIDVLMQPTPYLAYTASSMCGCNKTDFTLSFSANFYYHMIIFNMKLMVPGPPGALGDIVL